MRRARLRRVRRLRQAALALEHLYPSNGREQPYFQNPARWLHQLEALTEVGNALTREPELSRVLHLVAERLRELIGARLVLIELPTAEGACPVRARGAREGGHESVGIAVGVLGPENRARNILKQGRLPPPRTSTVENLRSKTLG